jgi:hypothetical protein
VSVDEPESNEATCQPEDGRQEGERDIGLPFLAGALLCDIAPIEDAAAVERTDELFFMLEAAENKGYDTLVASAYIDQKTESNDPSNEQEEIHRPVDESSRERKEPEQCKQYGQTCDDFGVDEARSGPGALAPGVVEIFAGQTSYDGCEGELDLVSGSSLGQLDARNSPRRCEGACQGCGRSPF